MSGPVQTNVAESLLVAAGHNMGIASVPVYAAIDGLSNGSLVHVLPEYTLQRINIYAIYASRQYLDAKIRTSIEFIRDDLRRAIANDETTLKELTLSDEARGLLLSQGRSASMQNCLPGRGAGGQTVVPAFAENLKDR